eukprot:gene10075-11151_t
MSTSSVEPTTILPPTNTSSPSSSGPALSTSATTTTTTQENNTNNNNNNNNNINNLPPEISKEEILRQIFGDVGKAIDDFSCAVESTVLLHGRMYVTTKFVCFYSNLFGLEKKIRIPYSHIKSITKETTAMVIPNAICISTDKRDYLFRSFWDREECYKILSTNLDRSRSSDVRRSSVALPPPPMDSTAIVGGSGSNSLATSVRLASSPISPTPPVPTNTTSTTSVPASDSAEPSPIPLDRRASRRMSTGGILLEDGFEDSESGFRSGESSRPASVNLTGDAKATFHQELTKGKMKLQVVNATLDLTLKEFELLFLAENAPYNYKRYHESVKDTKVVMTSWSEPSPGLGVGREIRFFKPVNLPGLASTRGVKVQRLRKFGTYGMILYSVTKLEDVPAADAFSVDDLLGAYVVGENKIMIEISFQSTWVKSSFMRYLIDINTNSEMTKWMEALYEHFRKVGELYKAGKVELELPPAEDQATVPQAAAPVTLPAPVPEVKPALPPPPTESVVVKTEKESGGWKDSLLQDPLRLLLLLILLVFVVRSYAMIRNSEAKIDHLEQTVQSLQASIESLRGQLIDYTNNLHQQAVLSSQEDVAVTATQSEL